MPSDGYLTTRRHDSTTGVGGSTTVYSGPSVDYINQTDIEVEKVLSGATLKVILSKVTSDPSATQYTLDTTTTPPQITLGLAMASGDVLRVRRKTARGSREVDFVQGATLTEADLDKATKQGIYLAEEAIDRAKDAEDEAARIGGSSPATLPASGGANNILSGVDSTTWEAVSIAQLKSDLSLGNASEKTVGTGSTQVPLNSDLGTASTKAHGTASGEVPLNSDLGTASLKNHGTTDGTIPLLTTGNALPAVSGANLTNLPFTAPRVTFTHELTSDGVAANTSSASAYMDANGNITRGKWGIRPFNVRTVANIAGEEEDAGLELVAYNGTAAAASGVGGSANSSNIIKVTNAGTYSVEWFTHWLRVREVITRLVKYEDAPGVSGFTGDNDGVLLTGTVNVSGTDHPNCISLGMGVIRTSAEPTYLRLEFNAYANAATMTQDDSMGEGYMVQTVDAYPGESSPTAAYLKNVWAYLTIQKLAST